MISVILENATAKCRPPAGPGWSSMRQALNMQRFSTLGPGFSGDTVLGASGRSEGALLVLVMTGVIAGI